MLTSVTQEALLRESFRQDVIEGLSAHPKRLPSRWLYDVAGSHLFEAITQLDEYYPTRTETTILRDNARDIGEFAGDGAALIEYGAGAGIKTQIVLDALRSPTVYMPIDISGDFLASTAERLRERYTGLAIQPVVADFTEDLDLPATAAARRRVAFFPGSTIGNLDQSQAVELLRRMRLHVGPGGRAVIGMDLVKEVSTLIRAYDDNRGITADFNLNLLRRINRELDATLPLDAFDHEARWNERERAIEMHLCCRVDLEATVDGHAFQFRVGETIHTESSRKYELADIEALVQAAGWRWERLWRDDGKRFAVVGLVAPDIDPIESSPG